MNMKFELNPALNDASLEKACDLANALAMRADMSKEALDKASDLHYMLEYLRLNYNLVPRKEG